MGVFSYGRHTRKLRGVSFIKSLIPFMGFSGGSAGKESACNVGDLGSIPGLGRSPEKEHGNTLQYSGLWNSMDCYSATLYRVAKS